ncbi:selection and upkeep of intraepithelial T-cells protein 5-like isoform X3 [Siniperca chuatsi]|uniref:selection and upkeep of intraepithelial T-cells protein 5-like isoform X3 n=1 Tax=Siniperca chuatsi TaxID=119488 RepID=UPI001CE221D3|nr:selection and upkeep of intraepithelial T-cells protein 5-like isoform X3 [Siniperca chuatsi]
MLHQTDGLSLQSPLRPLSVLLFHLLLIHSCRGQYEVIGPPQPIVAGVGDDIILPCHLKPAVDVTSEILEWKRSDLNPIFVHVRRAGQDLEKIRNPSYKGRTSLFTDELKHGNISLKLSKVQLSDKGTYECYMPVHDKQSSVELVVASDTVSSPDISLQGMDRNRGVILNCESAGWYPEPEVLWLDGEGKLVSVGPTETIRSPDGLYTVSSRVTVETRHGNNFTCRVQQQNINQTRETHIHVPDDFFDVQSSSSPVTVVLAVSLAVCIVFSSAVVFFVCKWRQKIKTKRSRSEETLMEGNRAAPASSSWLTSWNLYKWFKDEHQRRVEAETKVESLTADVQMLKEEKEKSVKQLIKELETKNKELDSLKDVQMLKEEKEKSEKQLKTKNQELQEEKTRREEAEEEVENLKTELQTKVESLKDVLKLKEEKEKSEKQLKKELETKNKKVESLTADVQKLKEEMEKSEKQLETKNKEVESLKDVLKLKEEKEKSEKQLKKELETKNKKVDSLTADVQKLKEEKEKSEKQLKKELETKNKKVESLTADVQKLKEEKEKSEKQLETKKQELQDEKTRREKAEKQVENLKTELQTKQDNSSSASLSSRGNVQ